MRIDIATLFPEMCENVFSESILGRGIKNGFIEVYAHNIRDYTENKHRNVDDKPYGGGTGMVMQAQPIFDCVEAIKARINAKSRVIYLSPKGETLTQKKVAELAREESLILICGHYEGVDERVLEELEAEEISVGDYVLTGGELPALIITDAVARLQKGVLPNENAYSIESHYNGLLEFPQYSRPEEWRGRRVPEVLISGDHKSVREWQEKMSIEVTKKKRPDLYEAFVERKIREIRENFIREKNPEIGENAAFSVLTLTREQLKTVLRGKRAELPNNGYAKGDYVILANEQMIPRCIVIVTKAMEKSVYFRTVYKIKGENND